MCGSGLVRKSAHIYIEGINFKSTFLVSIRSRRKWYLKSTYHILSLNFGLLASLIHDWLSQNRVMVGMLNNFNSSSMDFIHTPFAAETAATYSASVEDNATVVCFFDLHVIAAPASV